MTTLYVSPHLDDAVLSCGGRLVASTDDTVVVTVFAGMTPAKDSPHADGRRSLKCDDRRRREDETALELVGSRPIHLDYLDCIYRRYNGRPLVRQRRDQYRAGDEEATLVHNIAHDIGHIVYELDARTIVGPLAVGSHRDHLLSRRAVELTVAHLTGRRLLYYEDIPYALPRFTNLRRQTVRLVPEFYQLDSSDLKRKFEAIHCYSSQASVLWVDDGFGAFCERIEKYAMKHGAGRIGERYWRRSSSTWHGSRGSL